ncbi:hypothetical protein [Ferribacterium limneticum]|uniref:hypothetical protein n=1 Tax=Ferribacterium limneticum TaxID=76259 RepID=UPI001CF8154C|nr:hypothetical protein [Ferribacterium limneticum]UCV26705.1 hypothetical protein KI617_10330 [Ferribacterium limneticum]UCV30622.1 hypothetical protein KI608_10330 [Ferribacterium limneticum]
MKTISLILAAVLAVSLAACGNSEQPATKAYADVNVIDQNQAISRDNATVNARRFAADVYPNLDTRVAVQSDSSVKKDCRFGDGWASGEIYNAKTGQLIDQIKCQTNGNGKGIYGCLPTGIFKSKDYAAEDGRCNTEINALEKFK